MIKERKIGIDSIKSIHQAGRGHEEKIGADGLHKKEVKQARKEKSKMMEKTRSDQVREVRCRISQRKTRKKRILTSKTLTTGQMKMMSTIIKASKTNPLLGEVLMWKMRRVIGRMRVIIMKRGKMRMPIHTFLRIDKRKMRGILVVSLVNQ